MQQAATSSDEPGHEAAIPTLILDPRLPPEVIRFIDAQSKEQGARYRIEMLTEGETDDLTDKAIRDAVMTKLGSMAVVASQDTATKLEFVDLPATTVLPLRRGYKLVSGPAIPLPPRPSARLYDDHGMPMCPIELPVAIPSPIRVAE